jgi:hypothetical protein
MRIRTGIIWIVMMVEILSCDNKTNLPDFREKSFIKVYGSETSNEAVDLVYNGPENELIILAKADDGGEQGSRDIMLIKTDLNGNNSSYFFTYTTGIDEDPVRMVREGTELYIAGTLTENGEKDMMLALFSLNTNTFLWVNAYGEPGRDEEALSVDLQGNEIVLAGNAQDSIDIDDDQNVDVFGIVKNVRIIDMEGNEILESPRKNPGKIKDIRRFNENVYHALSQEIDPVTGDVNVQIDVGLFDGNFGNGFAPRIEGNDFPVNMIRLNSKILALGFMGNIPQNPDNSLGTFLLVSSFDRVNGNLIGNTSAVIQEPFSSLDVIPSKMVQAESNHFLILGTSKTGNNNTIRLIKFEETPEGRYNLLWDHPYGTQKPEDQAASVLPDENNDIYFNATVYFLQSPLTKVALFKTDVNGQLDF